MNKILVPTDFSKNANNALLYAIQLANHFEAEVELLHAYDAISTTGSLMNVLEYVRENADRDMASTIKKFSEHLSYGTKLTGRTLESSPIDAIISAERSGKIDLIVMGTKGASGIKKIIWGSNTAAVMQEVSTPLLAIPTDFKYRKPNEITLSLDSQKVSKARATFEPLFHLLGSFKARLSILHVLSEKSDTDFDHGVVDLAKEKHMINFIYKLEGYKADINQLLNEFSKANPTDMLCMIRREQGFWNRLFQKSVTTNEIFDCPVPLLVLKEKK